MRIVRTVVIAVATVSCGGPTFEQGPPYVVGIVEQWLHRGDGTSPDQFIVRGSALRAAPWLSEGALVYHSHDPLDHDLPEVGDSVAVWIGGAPESSDPVQFPAKEVLIF